jgi:hypothetical protein
MQALCAAKPVSAAAVLDTCGMGFLASAATRAQGRGMRSSPATFWQVCCCKTSPSSDQADDTLV